MSAATMFSFCGCDAYLPHLHLLEVNQPKSKSREKQIKREANSTSKPQRKIARQLPNLDTNYGLVLA